jgi:hypothetical protein
MKCLKAGNVHYLKKHFYKKIKVIIFVDFGIGLLGVKNKL